MTTDDSARKCASTCWYVAVGLGLLLAVVLIGAAEWSLLWGLLFGVLAFLILGFVLPQLVCTSGAQRPMASQQPNSSLVSGDPAAPLPGGPHASAASAAAATPPYVGDEADEKPAPQAHPVASEARRARPEAESGGASPTSTKAPTDGVAATAAPAASASAAAASVPASKPAKAEPAPKPKPAAKAKPAAKSKPAAKAKDTPAATGAGEKPETLSAPRAGGADDLKWIKGVGPKLETMLNDMGFYHYDQIAKWSDAEVAWVDGNVPGFKGRASRDDWRGQAKTLASGGTTEFSARASKGGVY
ncbi:endonuclease [Roseovarius aquimarinus]|uniref:Endonuclease n=1 Tax=Roseovarius aquimarinus TaxID=1229156 RepID=A0ABW7I4P2_9RHOB